MGELYRSFGMFGPHRAAAVEHGPKQTAVLLHLGRDVGVAAAEPLKPQRRGQLLQLGRLPIPVPTPVRYAIHPWIATVTQG